MIKISSNLKLFTRELQEIESKQLNFAEVQALNEIAKQAASEITLEIAKVFDKPKPSTTATYPRGPLFVRFAKRKTPKPFAEIRVKDDRRFKGTAAINYLSHHIYGGARVQKRSEFLLRSAGILPAGRFIVPGSAAVIDRYGNVSNGQIQQILSFFGARIEYKDNTRKESKSFQRLNGRYFLARANDPRTRHLPEGIWIRNGTSGASRPAPVLLFVRAAPSYRKRLRFFEIQERIFREDFPQVFDVWLSEALRTARRS